MIRAVVNAIWDTHPIRPPAKNKGKFRDGTRVRSRGTAEMKAGAEGTVRSQGGSIYMGVRGRHCPIRVVCDSGVMIAVKRSRLEFAR